MNEIELLRGLGDHIDAHHAVVHQRTEDPVLTELAAAAEGAGTSTPRRRARLVPGLATMITGAVVGTAVVLGLVVVRGSAPERSDLSAGDQAGSTGSRVPAASDGTADRVAVDTPAAGDAGVLVTADGWEMTQVHTSDSDSSPRVSEGSATFADGSARVELSWSRPHPDAPPADLGSGDRLIVDGVNGEGRLDEESPHAATVVGDGYHYRILGFGFASQDMFRAVVESIMWVDETSWLAALPESAVRPGGRVAAVDDILVDIPVPESVDVDALKSSEVAADTYHLTAEVTGAVACGWFDQYVAATEAGDTAAVEEAREALATAREWDALVAIEAEGGWSDVLWEYADALATGGTVGSGGGDVNPTDVVAGNSLDSGDRYYEGALCP